MQDIAKNQLYYDENGQRDLNQGVVNVGSVVPADYVTALNDMQQEAVLRTDGPLLVLAGAGTGKTKVLTTRIAHLIATKRAFPSQVLAVTFTNKAAGEMRDRVLNLIGDAGQGVWIGTFHSIAARILRRYAGVLGFSEQFTIIDSDDQQRVVKQLLSEHHIDDKKVTAKQFVGLIQHFKDRYCKPSEVRFSDVPKWAQPYGFPQLYAEYQSRLLRLNVMDFGDLLYYCVQLFMEQPDLLKQYQQQFRYVLVDEYQDTNVIQYLWLRLLVQEHKNICCVGDDDQSIYGWRGAEIENILRFERDFPGAHVVRLEQNYRSTSPILATASHLIAKNEGRLGKTLWTHNQEEAEPIQLVEAYNQFQEAEFVASSVQFLLSQEQHAASEIAVLVRAGFQTRNFEEAFMAIGIPYKVVGGLRFYERQEIKDVIAYIRLVVQPADDLAFERIINVPKRGIGGSTLQAIYQVANEEQIPLLRAAEKMLTAGMFKPKAAEALRDFVNKVQFWSKIREEMHHTAVVEKILEESGYLAMWKEERTPEADARIDNIKELVRGLHEFDSIMQFLEYVSLVSDTDDMDDSEMVRIMTLHSAKGLEFDTVFLPGWEQGLFPSKRSVDEKGTKGLEEERRLAYVGITRAKKRVCISYATQRRIYNQVQWCTPSQFIEELPQNQLQLASTNSYGGSRQQYTKNRQSQHYSRSNYAGLRHNQSKKNASSVVHDEVIDAPPGVGMGKRVFHQKFGYGTILQCEGDHLEIAFEQAGTKWVVADYVTLAEK